MIKDQLKKRLPIKVFNWLMHAKNFLFPTSGYIQTAEHLRNLKLFYSNFIDRGELVFDIGANFGNRTAAFLSIGAKVIAVEPNPECIRFLKGLYGRKAIFIQKGVGANVGVLDFYLADSSTLSTFSKDWINTVSKDRFKSTKWENVVKTPITTLDNLIEEYGTPKFIKIDVEGFEFEVLRGLSQKIKYLSFEYIPEKKDNIIKCILHLKEMGEIIINYSSGESMQLNLKQWVDPDVFIDYIKTDDFNRGTAGDIYVQYIN